MKTIGIIAEYNPIHLGHTYQLSYLADEFPHALRIVLMSGDMVQRGTPAFFSKFDRAHWAILCGADVVLELNSYFALGSAEIFATGAMRTLDALGVDAFSFGSEVTNLDLLESIAQAAQHIDTLDRTRELIKGGTSYGQAMREALTELVPHAALVVNQPNALLGLEYLKAINQYQLNLMPLPLERTSRHHDKQLGGALPSGTALRETMRQYSLIDDEHFERTLQPYFHEDVLPLVMDRLRRGQYTNLRRYEDFIHYRARMMEPRELSQLGDFADGIESIWHKYSSSSNWASARDKLKSKRYSYARLDRMGAYTLLNRSRESILEAHEEGPRYARLLAFSSAGRSWLKENTSQIPIVQKWAPFYHKTEGYTRMLAEADHKATALHSLCYQNSGHRQEVDFTTSPLYLP